MPGKASPQHVDPRVKRTRRLLREALVGLILEKDYAAISIKEITTRAEVAYITFYRHYESRDQLLMEVLDAGLADLRTHIDRLAKQSDEAALETEGRLIFEHIQQNADLFRILLKSQSVARIRSRVVRTIATTYQKSCAPLERVGDRTTVNLATHHIATALLSLIEWWLEHDRRPAPTEMGRVYKSLIIDSTLRAVGALSARPE